jgi:hypothetical protein
MLLHPSNPKHCFVHTSVEQWGTAMHREPFMPGGKAPAVGQRHVVRRELKALVRDVLKASAAKQPDKKLSLNPDDFYLHLFNIGWEGIGHWEAESELSELSLAATPTVGIPEKETSK